jgi:uncharacterized membrane protein
VVDASQDHAAARSSTIVVWCIFLATVIVTIVTLTFPLLVVGVVGAYAKRRACAGTPFESHMTSVIRTFWIAFIGLLVCSACAGASYALAFRHETAIWPLGLAIVLALAILIWLLWRTIRGLVRAIQNRPIANPTGWI